MDIINESQMIVDIINESQMIVDIINESQMIVGIINESQMIVDIINESQMIVVNRSASNAVGREFVPQPGHARDPAGVFKVEDHSFVCYQNISIRL